MQKKIGFFSGHLLPQTEDKLSGASDTYRHVITGAFDVNPSSDYKGMVKLTSLFNYKLTQHAMTEDTLVIISSDSEDEQESKKKEISDKDTDETNTL